jgi:2-succinyl-5-enolpyruvyl-6-hydroxy-3-cyclohexene-1-carboxylate synthase
VQQHVFAISNACHQLGVKHVFICPGSRSAPLVYAFTENKHFTAHSVVDERSAAYSAMGAAQQLQQPVVLICTSGTAALNFYPAIAEAFFQHIPLLVLTADRPPGLLFQQDGQMINQSRVFENHVLTSYSFPCYAHGKENMLETFDITANALQLLNGLRKGPVHINVPLNEPLYPTKLIRPSNNYRIKNEKQQIQIADKGLISAWKSSKKRLIIVGQQFINTKLSTQLLRMNNDGNTIVITDLLSNQIPFGSIHHADTILLRADKKTKDIIEPDFIISFGGPVLSKQLKQWLKTIKPTYHYRINAFGECVDTYGNVSNHLVGNADQYLALLPNSQDTNIGQFKKFWLASDSLISNTVSSYLKKDNWSEIHTMHKILLALPDAANIHLANSGVIRYVSMCGQLNPSWVMNGNRGTSGIDGCTSTAVGAALVNNRETFLLSGDLSFLYDINGLWRSTIPNNIKIIVFNNQKGQIFEWIEGPQKQRKQLPFFTTPHQRNIGDLCKAFKIKHVYAEDNKSLRAVLPKFLKSPEPAVLELSFSNNENMKSIKAFKTIPLKIN